MATNQTNQTEQNNNDGHTNNSNSGLIKEVSTDIIAKIKSINNRGVMTVIFNVNLDVPDNITSIN